MYLNKGIYFYYYQQRPLVCGKGSFSFQYELRKIIRAITSNNLYHFKYFYNVKGLIYNVVILKDSRFLNISQSILSIDLLQYN